MGINEIYIPTTTIITKEFNLLRYNAQKIDLFVTTAVRISNPTIYHGVYIKFFLI
jgi:hypothetical protein